MALATTDDVRRYVPGNPADAALSAMLESAEAWVRRTTGADWDAEGVVTERFYDVRDGSVLTLKDEAPSALTVTAYLAPGSSGSALVADSGYHLRDGGLIELLWSRYGSPSGLPGATVSLLPTEWSRIEISYTASETVPTPVREATAMICAASYLDAQGAGSLLQERLGDYSYSREPDGAKLPIPRRADVMLRPYSRRLRSRST